MIYKQHKILTKQAYNRLFSSKSNSKRKKALEHARDTRKFEIDHYWSRASYFLALLTLTFTGFFFIASADSDHLKDKPQYLLVISSIGLVLSFGWHIANRGSKYWQETWEKHVDMLEDTIMGPVQKTHFALSNWNLINPLAPFRFSVSQVNQIISLYAIALWVFFFSKTLSEIYQWYEPFPNFNIIYIVSITGLAILAILIHPLFPKFRFWFRINTIVNK